MKKNVLNSDIKADIVNLVKLDGLILKNISISQAQDIADDAGLDLVQVNENGSIAICKLMDYGKVLYAKKKSANKVKHKPLKEIKFRPSTDIGDIKTKVNKIKAFLEASHDVKLAVYFKGREQAHKENGFKMIDKILKSLTSGYKVKSELSHQGRAISMVICA